MIARHPVRIDGWATCRAKCQSCRAFPRYCSPGTSCPGVHVKAVWSWWYPFAFDRGVGCDVGRQIVMKPSSLWCGRRMVPGSSIEPQMGCGAWVLTVPIRYRYQPRSGGVRMSIVERSGRSLRSAWRGSAEGVSQPVNDYWLSCPMGRTWATLRSGRWRRWAIRRWCSEVRHLTSVLTGLHGRPLLVEAAPTRWSFTGRRRVAGAGWRRTARPVTTRTGSLRRRGRRVCSSLTQGPILAPAIVESTHTYDC